MRRLWFVPAIVLLGFAVHRFASDEPAGGLAFVVLAVVAVLPPLIRRRRQDRDPDLYRQGLQGTVGLYIAAAVFGALAVAEDDTLGRALALLAALGFAVAATIGAYYLRKLRAGRRDAASDS